MINLGEFFKDIKDNRTDGSSTLAEKTLIRIAQYIEEFGTDELPEVLNYSESFRKDMVIIRNSVRKLKDFIASEKNINSEKLIRFISGTVENLKAKKQELIKVGIEILRNYSKIAVASFSSIIKGIVDRSEDKIFLALEEDKFARNLGSKVMLVSQDEIISADVGIMGADAVIKSGSKIWLINGVPSRKVAKLLKNRKIFVFAESEKFTYDDFSPSEKILEKFEIGENFSIIST